jgi:uncharacterized protein (TIGR02145 family)
MKNRRWIKISQIAFIGLLLMLYISCKKSIDSNPSGGNTVSDKDGNVYHTVTIGTQVWMAENLKTTKYNDGAPISNITDGTAWTALTTPAFCWYNNDSVGLKVTGYGALYNWYAVNSGKLCPTGWHVPSDAEWTKLTAYLGGDTFAGGKLKEAGTTHWTGTSPGCDNSSGFTALGSGWRDLYSFYYGGYGAMWWSSTADNTANAWYRGMYYFVSSVERKTKPKSDGFSIRCLKDN